MKNAAGEITIDGLHDAVEPPAPEELAAIERLAARYRGLQEEPRTEAPRRAADGPFYDRLCFQRPLTINGFHGGYGGPGTKTVLPNEAW